MLVRALVADRPGQVAGVRKLIARNTIFISRTVLLEAEWVLRSRYRKTPAQLLAFFNTLLETDNTVVEDAEAVSHSLNWYGQGADFADALHLAACNSAVMHTVDRIFCRAAGAAGIRPDVKVWEVRKSPRTQRCCRRAFSPECACRGG